jgi:hypothetical protein
MSHRSGKTRTQRRASKHHAVAEAYLDAFLTLFPPHVVQRIARESSTWPILVRMIGPSHDFAVSLA